MPLPRDILDFWKGVCARCRDEPMMGGGEWRRGYITAHQNLELLCPSVTYRPQITYRQNIFLTDDDLEGLPAELLKELRQPKEKQPKEFCKRGHRLADVGLYGKQCRRCRIDDVIKCTAKRAAARAHGQQMR